MSDTTASSVIQRTNYYYKCPYCAYESEAFNSYDLCEKFGKEHQLAAHVSKAETAWLNFYAIWTRTLSTQTFKDLKEEAYYSTLEYCYKNGYHRGLKDAS